MSSNTHWYPRGCVQADFLLPLISPGGLCSQMILRICKGRMYCKDLLALATSLDLLLVASFPLQGFLKVRISQRWGLHPLLAPHGMLSPEEHIHLPFSFPRMPSPPVLCQQTGSPSSTFFCLGGSYSTSKGQIQGHHFRAAPPHPRLVAKANVPTSVFPWINTCTEFFRDLSF